MTSALEHYSKVIVSSRPRTYRRIRPTQWGRPFKSTCTSMSGIAMSRRRAPQAGSRRKIGGGKRLSDLVIADMGGSAQPFEQPKRVQHRRVDANADSRVPLFNTLQRCPRGKGPRGDDAHGKATPETSLANVNAELTKGAAGCCGRIVRCRHVCIVSNALYDLNVLRRSQKIYFPSVMAPSLEGQ